MASKEIDHELNVAIGAKLQRVRMRANEKQSNIAEAMNVSSTTYSKHEHGKVDFTVTKLKQIAAYFRVNLSDFLDEGIEIPRLLKDLKTSTEYKSLEAKYELLRELYDTEKQQNQKMR
jgi:transcriptional regulator with XRE-family HTH domain